MVKIEAIVRPGTLEDIKEALVVINVRGLTVSQVMGCGLQKGRKEYYRGTEVTLNLLPKVKIELVADDSQMEDIIKIIADTARTGEVGDGKIFVYDVKDAVRIRTGERGHNAFPSERLRILLPALVGAYGFRTVPIFYFGTDAMPFIPINAEGIFACIPNRFF